MNTAPEPIERAQRHGESLARSRGFELFARAGLVARGVVYGTVGLLALKVALGDSGGKTTSQQGALKEIAHQPFGKFLLIATAVGIAGYASWRILRALLGHGPEAEDSTFDRIGGIISGIGYALLFATAVSILVGSGSTSGGGAPKTTSDVLGWTGGQWIVAIAGLCIIGEGLEQGYKGLTRKFLEKSKTEEMSASVKSAFTKLGTFGHLARMVVFCLIGYFLTKAAIDYNPQSAVTLDGALGSLAHATFGPAILGVVSAGLIGFGLYSLADARYRKL